MTPDNNVDSADTVLKLKNIIWSFPYLAVMGLIWGYLAGVFSGAMVGLAAAAGASVLIGSITPIFAETPAGSTFDTPFGPTRNTMPVHKRLASDLNVVRYHKLCHRFDDALLTIEEVLAEDPDFVEAFLLKAQILWEGFGDAEAARGCLLKILVVEPDEKAMFHRWTLNMYKTLSQK